jgi:hypothetical protein
LEEYKTLRDAIKRCESETLAITLFCITASSIVIGTMDKLADRQLPAALLLHVILLWGMNRYYALTTLRCRLSAYIETVIEPNDASLKWETLNSRLELALARNRGKLRQATSMLFRGLSHVFFTLSVAVLVVSISSISSATLSSLGSLAIAVLLLIACLLTSISAVRCILFRPTQVSAAKLWKSLLADDARGDG